MRALDPDLLRNIDPVPSRAQMALNLSVVTEVLALEFMTMRPLLLSRVPLVKRVCALWMLSWALGLAISRLPAVSEAVNDTVYAVA